MRSVIIQITESSAKKREKISGENHNLMCIEDDLHEIMFVRHTHTHQPRKKTTRFNGVLIATVNLL